MAYTTYVDPSAVGVHNEKGDDIWSICTYSLTHSLCYAMHVPANICSEYARLLIAFSG